ncbi:oxidoreductase, partial [Cellulomonas bogoriensis 69B4 = DSM 16987]
MPLPDAPAALAATAGHPSTDDGPGGGPVRSVIVGTGGIAGAHAGAVLAQGGATRLVAVVDLDRPKAEEFARAWDVPVVATDLADVLGRHQVDVVHVCTPPGTHAGLATQALAAGAHVLLEKPPALSLAEVDQVLHAQDAARGTGPGGRDPQVAVVFQHRFGAGAGRLRSLLDAGVLGRCLVARCDTQWFRPPGYFDVPWRGR